MNSYSSLSQETSDKELQFKRLKQAAVISLKTTIIFNSMPEKKLWFAVLDRAIHDIGLWEIRESRKGDYFQKSSFNTDNFFEEGISGFDYMCDMLDLAPDYVISILKKYGILPFPLSYYENIQNELESNNDTINRTQKFPIT